jgi:hypothetical protein
MINKLHPYESVRKLLEELPPDAELEFSTYKYEPQSILDTRNTFRVAARELSQTAVERLIIGLDHGTELAFHSLVRHSKKVYHVPMVDFRIEQSALESSLDAVEKILPKTIFKEMIFYNSGRSCHAYSLTLISNKEWLDFMGRLLLISLPQDEQMIDTRWIGHRLMGGFSSLRWSNNSGLYLAMPQRIF